MFNGSWLRYITAVVLQIAAIVFLMIAGLGVWQQYNLSRQTYREYQHGAEYDQQKTADKIARECSVIIPSNPAFRDCLAEKLNAYQKQNTTNKDLQAQQDMAFWAFWLFNVSVIGTIIGVAGFWILVISLRHTRTAIKDTRELGEAEIRAYMGFVNSEATPFRLSEIKTGEKIEVGFTYRNNGGSPANRVVYIAKCEVMNHPMIDDRPTLMLPHPDAKIAPNTIQKNGINIGSGFTENTITEEDRKNIFESKDKRLYLIARIEYDDVFGKTRHYTNGCFYFEFTPVVSPSGSKRGVGRWYMADTHNDAD